MRRRALVGVALAWTVLFFCWIAYADPASDAVPEHAPAASIDLTTTVGVRAVGGTWRFADVAIVETAFRRAGADGQPTGPVATTYDIVPHAGSAGFDDTSWTVVAPEDLDVRRGNGRLSFCWYRITIEIPQTVGGFDPTGSTVVFETSVDDYAEVWVDGELPRLLGQSGGSVIRGWNAANRLVIGRDVEPGQRITLAVFGMNGPISNPVTNYIWMRSAKLEFYLEPGGPRAIEAREVNVEVVRLDPAIDAIVPANPKIHKLAEGFELTEGPLWSPEGFLLFSDAKANRIYKYVPDGILEVWKERSGDDGVDAHEHRRPGSNGSALGDEAIDGVEVDSAGNVYVSRPGGVWVLSNTGKHLGTIVPPRLPASFAWGDADRRSLYLTARSGLYRMRLQVPGAAGPSASGKVESGAK